MRDLRKVQRRLYVLSGVIAFAGACCSALAYLNAAAGTDGGAIGVAGSKMYRRGLLLYGGQLNVVFDDFSRWFGGLWEGRNLSVSLAVITVVLSGLCFLVARNIVEVLPGSEGK